MKKTLTFEQCVDTLMSDPYANWSIEAAESIIRYLMELDDVSQSESEFDPINIRCSFSEYDSVQQLLDDYSHISNDDDSELSINDISNHTYVNLLSNGHVIIIDF